MEKPASFRSAPALFLSPVGDFRNRLETLLNFRLNRVIIQRGSGAARRRRPNGIENIQVAMPRGNFSKLQVVLWIFGII